MTRETKPITIRIDENTHRYHMAWTTAPKAYDHGMTIEVQGSYPDPSMATETVGRIVLIRSVDWEWQTGRNLSGMHATREVNDHSIREAVTTLLWSRLFTEVS